jgi:uncharacterized membrane protein
VSTIQQQTHAPMPVQTRNGLGTTALVLGIVGIALAWIPIIGYVAFVLGVVGVVLGAVGYRKTRKRQADNPKVAMWGLVLSALTVVFSIAAFALFINAVDNASNDLQSYSDCIDAVSVDSANFAGEMAACDNLLK